MILNGHIEATANVLAFYNIVLPAQQRSVGLDGLLCHFDGLVHWHWQMASRSIQMASTVKEILGHPVAGEIVAAKWKAWCPVSATAG